MTYSFSPSFSLFLTNSQTFSFSPTFSYSLSYARFPSLSLNFSFFPPSRPLSLYLLTLSTHSLFPKYPLHIFYLTQFISPTQSLSIFFLAFILISLTLSLNHYLLTTKLSLSPYFYYFTLPPLSLSLYYSLSLAQSVSISISPPLSLTLYLSLSKYSPRIFYLTDSVSLNIISLLFCIFSLSFCLSHSFHFLTLSLRLSLSLSLSLSNSPSLIHFSLVLSIFYHSPLTFFF
ncbi:unnamed protein product [Acanthosepion pharaonis]|uniref:Uncharacterized protein n=1 Tax=Acanthosepion pharaonis TaxID=158019 RepID=A0A812D3E5_ACAPH|nr:unnamed protein product [Sepia pharaonis]